MRALSLRYEEKPSVRRKALAAVFIVFVMAAVFLPCAAEIDPILLDKPSPVVFECSPNLFLEVPGPAYIMYTLGNESANGYFLSVKAEVLYLEDTVWDGIDKSSFQVKHTDSEGHETLFPMNYMMTARESLINEWPTMSEPLFFGWLLPLNPVFNVPLMEKDGWTLVFRPAERGGEAVCSVEVPLSIRIMEDGR